MSFQLRHALLLLYQPYGILFPVFHRPVRFGFHPLGQHQKTSVAVLVITHAPCLRVQLLQTLFLLAENIHVRVYLHALAPQQAPGRGKHQY